MNLYELWKHFRLLSEPEGYSPQEREFLERFLAQEYVLKEQKKREVLSEQKRRREFVIDQ